MSSRPALVPLLFGIVSLVGAAGCSDNSTDGAAPTTVTSPSTSSTVASTAGGVSTSAPTSTQADGTPGGGSSDLSGGSGGGDCGGAAATVKAHLTNAAVTKVDVDGGCSNINITTSLTDDVSTALSICDQAAEVAYTGKVMGIRVESATSRELSIGIKGSPCIGEP